MTYARVRKDITTDPVKNEADYWLYVGARDLEGCEIHFRPESEWVKAVCCDNELGLYVLTEDEETYFTADSIDLEFADEIPTEEPDTLHKAQPNRTLTRGMLMDWTNYDWKETPKGFAWVEHGSEIGVLATELYEGVVFIKNTDNLKGLEVSLEELKRYGAMAIDFVQFAEYVNTYEQFVAYAEALLAMDADYGLTGSNMGLDVSLPYGAWLDYEGGVYRLWNAEGMTFFATTPEGCARAWRKMEAIRPQIEWANAKRAGK